MPSRPGQSIAFWATGILMLYGASVASADPKAAQARVDQEIRISIGADAI